MNVVIFIFLKDKIDRENYKSYYRDFFPEDEFREIEVELSDEGIRTKSADAESFQIWDSVTEIFETKDTIYFLRKVMEFQ
ncbi:MAG: hypothetical protein HC846_11105 [Blastocatellia bacterium]|nr:hypothetical protein [Blastocatellia bacterium]